MKYNKDLTRAEAEDVIMTNREAMEDPHLQAMQQPAPKPVAEDEEIA